MSLYPGGPRLDGDRWVLDDLALENSMAKAIEDAMADLFEKVKETPLPDVGNQDRRILFVAIARGILQYLEDHETDIADVSIEHVSDPSKTHEVTNIDLDIDMDG